jgi:hypothetical protein
MTPEQVESKLSLALDELYRSDIFLIRERLCERCVAHRLAFNLEKQDFGPGYFVDCEYNKSHLNNETRVKIVSNPHGNYIDIVITKRNDDWRDDLACFETKYRSNYNGRKKDRENLEILTGRDGRFGYSIGFYVLFGENRAETKVEIYRGGVKQ